jgi:hypothetical protein
MAKDTVFANLDAPVTGGNRAQFAGFPLRSPYSDEPAHRFPCHFPGHYFHDIAGGKLNFAFMSSIFFIFVSASFL